MGFEPVTLQCQFKCFHDERTRSQVMNESGHKVTGSNSVEVLNFKVCLFNC